MPKKPFYDFYAQKEQCSTKLLRKAGEEDRLTPQVIKLVTREEIEKVAKLMRIELDDHAVHIDRVQKMIEYFDVLDKAGIESEEFDVQEKSITELREDKHIPFDEKLIEKLKSFKGTYIRAPKMV